MKKRFVAIAVGGAVAIGALLIPTASQADTVSDAAAVCAARPSTLCNTLFGPGSASLTPAAREALAAAILRQDTALNGTGATFDDVLLRDLFLDVIQRFQGTGEFDQFIRDALRGAFLQACAASGGSCTVSF